MQESSRSELSLTGINATIDSGLPPRSEPYLQPAYLDKPVLNIYDGEHGVTLDRVLLEEPDSCNAWIQTHKQALVNVEAQR